MFLFCLVFAAMSCARLFICALWSPAGKGLTSWLSLIVLIPDLCILTYYVLEIMNCNPLKIYIYI